MDIASALAERKTTSSDACRLGRWLAEIPAETPALDQLVAILLETDRASEYWRTLEEIDAILRRLGLTTSNKTIANHRGNRCRCFA